MCLCVGKINFFFGLSLSFSLCEEPLISSARCSENNRKLNISFRVCVIIGAIHQVKIVVILLLLLLIYGFCNENFVHRRYIVVMLPQHCWWQCRHGFRFSDSESTKRHIHTHSLTQCEPRTHIRQSYTLGYF